MSPSTSSPCKPQHDSAVQAAVASMIKDETLPSDLSQLTATKIATDYADHSMAHLLTTVDDKEQATAQVNYLFPFLYKENLQHFWAMFHLNEKCLRKM